MPSDSRTAVTQQLYETVLVLASEEGAIEERLAHAYFQYMQHVDSAALPPDARTEFESIRAEVGALYPRKGVIDGVERGTAINLAMRIILVYDSLLK